MARGGSGSCRETITTGRVFAARPKSASHTSPGRGIIKQVQNLLFCRARTLEIENVVVGKVDDLRDPFSHLGGRFRLTHATGCPTSLPGRPCDLLVSSLARWCLFEAQDCRTFSFSDIKAVLGIPRERDSIETAIALPLISQKADWGQLQGDWGGGIDLSFVRVADISTQSQRRPNTCQDAKSGQRIGTGQCGRQESAKCSPRVAFMAENCRRKPSLIPQSSCSVGCGPMNKVLDRNKSLFNPPFMHLPDSVRCMDSSREHAAFMLTRSTSQCISMG